VIVEEFQLDGAARDALDDHVVGLRDWVAGIVDWHRDSGRYSESALQRRYQKKPQRLGGPTGLGTSAISISGMRSPEVASPARDSQLAASLVDRFVTGPTGLGTSAAQLLTSTAATTSTPTSDGPPSERELYCPPALRDDTALGEEVNARLIDATGQVGIYSGQADRLHQASIGRLLMLAHSAAGRHPGLARR
jgi:2-methylisoborneol synthase